MKENTRPAGHPLCESNVNNLRERRPSVIASPQANIYYLQKLGGRGNPLIYGVGLNPVDCHVRPDYVDILYFLRTRNDGIFSVYRLI